MKQDEIIEIARNISKVLGSRMCDENGDTHGEELYCMAFDDIVDAVKLVAAKEREACSVLLEMNANHCKNMMEKMLLLSNAAAIRARGEA